MIYEHRVYEVIPGKMPAMHQRFTNVALRLFKKHDIQAVGFWTAIIGTSNQLIYLLAFRDMAHREKAWRAFQEDPEWIQARAESEKEGPLVARITNTLLAPTPYSPLQ